MKRMSGKLVLHHSDLRCVSNVSDWRVYSELRWSEMNWVRKCNFSFTWKKVSKSLLRIAFQSVMCSFFSKRMKREAEPISRKIAYCERALLSCGKKTLREGHSTRLGMQHHAACLKAFITDRCKSAIPPQFQKKKKNAQEALWKGSEALWSKKQLLSGHCWVWRVNHLCATPKETTLCHGSCGLWIRISHLDSNKGIS